MLPRLGSIKIKPPFKYLVYSSYQITNKTTSQNKTTIPRKQSVATGLISSTVIKL